MRDNTWNAILAELIGKFEVAANFNGSTTFNTEGSAAMAKLLKNIANKLDYAVSRSYIQNPDKSDHIDSRGCLSMINSNKD